MRSRSSAISGLISSPGTSGCITRLIRDSCRRSERSASSAPGYCSLTATSRPSRHTARCTWPMLAAAAGISSNSRKRLRQPRPNCSASIQCTSAGGHRRCGGLQLDQRLAERRGVLVRDGRLEHAQRLAELHGPALELAEHREQLLGALGHQLGGDLVAVATGQPASPAGRGPSGHAERQAGQLGRARRGAPGDVGHAASSPVPHGRRGVPPAGRCVSLVHTMIVSLSSGVRARRARRGEAHRCRRRRLGRAAPAAGCGSPGAAARSCRPSASSSRVVSQVGGRSPPLHVESSAASACATPSAAVAAVAAGSARPRRPVSWAATLGQPGARARRCSSRQPRQAVRPGSTSGPTTPIPSRIRTGRCAVPRGVQPREPGRLGGQRVGEHDQIGHQPRRRRRGVGVRADPAHRGPDRAASRSRPRSSSTWPVPRSPARTGPAVSVYTAPTPACDQPEDHPDGQRPGPADHDVALGPVPVPPLAPAPRRRAPRPRQLAQQLLGRLGARRPAATARSSSAAAGTGSTSSSSIAASAGGSRSHGQRDVRVEPEQPARRSPSGSTDRCGGSRSTRGQGRVRDGGGGSVGMPPMVPGRRTGAVAKLSTGRRGLWTTMVSAPPRPRRGLGWSRWRTPRSSRSGAVPVVGAWSAPAVRATP